MGKLKLLKPSVGALAPRLGYVPGDEKAIDRMRTRDQGWRGWYKLKRWADLKRAVFVRDKYICQRSGVLCIGKHPAPNSPVANHIVAHRGDERLFWDIDNVQTVSKAMHDSLIQAEERASSPVGRWY